MPAKVTTLWNTAVTGKMSLSTGDFQLLAFVSRVGAPRYISGINAGYASFANFVQPALSQLIQVTGRMTCFIGDIRPETLPDDYPLARADILSAFNPFTSSIGFNGISRVILDTPVIDSLDYNFKVPLQIQSGDVLSVILSASYVPDNATTDDINDQIAYLSVFGDNAEYGQNAYDSSRFPYPLR